MFGVVARLASFESTTFILLDGKVGEISEKQFGERKKRNVDEESTVYYPS